MTCIQRYITWCVSLLNLENLIEYTSEDELNQQSVRIMNMLKNLKLNFGLLNDTLQEYGISVPPNIHELEDPVKYEAYKNLLMQIENKTHFFAKWEHEQYVSEYLVCLQTQIPIANIIEKIFSERNSISTQYNFHILRYVYNQYFLKIFFVMYNEKTIIVGEDIRTIIEKEIIVLVFYDSIPIVQIRCGINPRYIVEMLAAVLNTGIQYLNFSKDFFINLSQLGITNNAKIQCETEEILERGFGCGKRTDLMRNEEFFSFLTSPNRRILKIVMDLNLSISHSTVTIRVRFFPNDSKLTIMPLVNEIEIHKLVEEIYSIRRNPNRVTPLFRYINRPNP